MSTIKSIYLHNPTPTQLERILRYMLRGGYRFLNIDELYCYLTGCNAIKGRLAFLSFDDAWRSNLQLIPIIERFNVPITIFAPTEPLESGNYWWEYVPREEREGVKRLCYADFCKRIDKARSKTHLERSCMTADEIKALANHPLVSIQSHTITHPILTAMPDDLAEKEIKESKERLETIIGREVNYFSYPNGSYREREVKVARNTYRMAFTTDLHYIARHNDLLALPRIELTGRFYRDLLKLYNVWPILRKIGCALLGKPQY